MANLFENSMIEECVSSFVQFLHCGPYDELMPLSSLHEAIMCWLISDLAFKSVGDDYELFLRVVIAIWLDALSGGDAFWVKVDGERVPLSLTVAHNDDTIWLLPEYFRHTHYKYTRLSLLR